MMMLSLEIFLVSFFLLGLILGGKYLLSKGLFKGNGHAFSGALAFSQAGKGDMSLDEIQLAHDIRSPIAVLKSILREEKGLDPERALILEKVLKRMDSMAMAALGGMQAEKNSEHFSRDEIKRIEIVGIVKDVIKEKQFEYGHCHFEWTLDLPSTALIAFASEHGLRRVLSNIINNAIEASPGDAKIEVSVKLCEERGVAVCVRDYGKGISTEVQEKLFAAGRSFGKKNGSGLGLYGAKKALESWQGDIELSSIVGEGTTVNLYLLFCDADVVLLDDDHFIRYAWTLIAKRKKIKLKSFSSADKLLSQTKSFDQKTVFYLDEDLGEGPRGQDVAKKLYALGHREIYLASGYGSEYFKSVPFIKGVVSKESPWFD